MNHKQLSVRLYGEPVGILQQANNGDMSFRYNHDAQQPLSISMPIREEAFTNNNCEAFFGGLLPESSSARQAIASRYRISPNNSFALLKAIGYDCAGAISLHEVNEPIKPIRHFDLAGRPVSDNSLYEHIKSLPKKPLFIDFGDLKLSLAGVQDKAAICIINNKVCLPLHGCPTTHILKPDSSNFTDLVVNEYFCLKLAKAIDLPVPNIEIRQLKDISFLLIERYDRKIADNKIERIHQEDFCQALSVPTYKKYQNEGGPDFKQCFDLLDNTIFPARDRNQLMQVVIFNYLIGNMDSHAKNFSLLHEAPSQVQLAPFYDIICTQVYPELSHKMAMKIGNKYQHDKILARHWKQLCTDINYGYPGLKKMINNQVEKLRSVIKIERDKLNSIQRDVSIADKIIDAIEKNIIRITKKF